MTTLEYLSGVSSIWKITLFMIIFCAWPLSAFIIFHYQMDIFLKLDILKLSLLASAMTAPFLVVNTGLTLLLTNPLNPALRSRIEGYDPIPVTAMIAAAFTTFVLSIGALLGFLNVGQNCTVIVMAILEGFYVLTTAISAIMELPKK